MAPLGDCLARLHEVDPSGMRPWPVADRLRERIQAPPTACTTSILRGIARMVEPWIALTADSGDHLVHGDYGLSNILGSPGNPTNVLAVVDLRRSRQVGALWPLRPPRSEDRAKRWIEKASMVTSKQPRESRSCCASIKHRAPKPLWRERRIVRS